ncbi:MAG TPA: isochorismatase family cysteine hydrolase [Bacillota bacterium]|jgi:nicotinamidase-related amidase
MNRYAVVVIDLIKGLVDAGATGDHDFEARTRSILPSVRRVLAEARAAAIPVVHVRIVHRRTPDGRLDDGGLSEMLRRQDAILGVKSPGVELVEGSEWVEFLDEVKPEAGEYVVRKNRYSAFYGGDFGTLLEALRVDTLIVVGVATNFCVRATCLDAFQKGWRTVVPREAVNTYSDRAQEQGLEDLQMTTTDVVGLEEAVRLIRQAKEG